MCYEARRGRAFKMGWKPHRAKTKAAKCMARESLRKDRRIGGDFRRRSRPRTICTVPSTRTVLGVAHPAAAGASEHIRAGVPAAEQRSTHRPYRSTVSGNLDHRRLHRRRRSSFRPPPAAAVRPVSIPSSRSPP